MRLYEIYQEYKSYFSHNGKQFDLNPIFKLSKSLPVKEISLSELEHCISNKLDTKRVSNADISIPILVSKLDGEYVIIDGAHRASLALSKGNSVIPCKIINSEYFQNNR